MRRGRSGEDFDPVGELHTLDQFWQLVVAVDAAPTLLGALDKLEDHGERGLGSRCRRINVAVIGVDLVI